MLEAADYPGGHTNTVRAEAFGDVYDIDTGFMVFNHHTYPNFTRLLRQLEIPAQDSDMSFSVRCEQSGIEYQGSSLDGLFAQRSNLFRPAFYRMLGDVLRFNRKSPELLDTDDDSLSIGEYLDRERYGHEFIQRYLIPMGAAIWSARPEKFRDFPARFLVGFLRNHGLLQIRNRPIWKTIPGGAQRYVEALVEPIRDRLRLNTPVSKVIPQDDHQLVIPEQGPAETFDRVVFATHADQTLRLLDRPTDAEREVLSAFPYQRNECVLHTDRSLLPRRHRAWASWNYSIPAGDETSTTCAGHAPLPTGSAAVARAPAPARRPSDARSATVLLPIRNAVAPARRRKAMATPASASATAPATANPAGSGAARLPVAENSAAETAPIASQAALGRVGMRSKSRVRPSRARR